jgi:hypothetical protein
MQLGREMALYKRHTVTDVRQPDGSYRYYRGWTGETEIYRVVLNRSREEFLKLHRRGGNSPDMIEILKWVKNPNLIGEYFWRTERTSRQGDLSIVFYFTQELTATAMKIAWA